MFPRKGCLGGLGTFFKFLIPYIPVSEIILQLLSKSNENLAIRPTIIIIMASLLAII